jgi:hypothetical protein
MNDLKIFFMQKLTQWITSIVAGLLIAVETSIDFFVPCFIAVILDVISAFFLGRRVHAKYPDKSDGKFKSEYKWRILATMIIAWLCIILASYVDINVRHSDDGLAVRFAVAVFLFYELWSCLENWSSENDKPIAKAMQRIMVNKAERHLNVPLSDILMPGDDGASEQPLNSKEDG